MFSWWEAENMTLAMRKGVFVEYTDSEGPDQTLNPRRQDFRYPPHCENTHVHIYIEKFTTKKWKYSDKKFWYISYF